MNLKKLRADTPGCADRVHLNNAGAGLMPRPVIDAIHGHIELEASVGGYEAADAREVELQGAYEAVGRLLGAHPNNMAFVENATVAFAQALSSIPFQPGDVILTTRDDYVSNQIVYLSLESRLGIEIVRAPNDPNGGVSLPGMEELIHRRRPKLVAVTHVPTNSGLVQPVEAVGALCREKDVPYLVDACQSVGQMPVDVGSLQCDFLSGTARKFLRGPRGAGFLYVSDRVLDRGLEPLFIDMRGADWIDADMYQPAPDAKRFENWEFSYALVLGMGCAARYALDLGLDAIWERCRALGSLTRQRLAALPDVRVLDEGPELCAIVTIHVEGRDPEALARELRRRGINTGASLRMYAVLDFDDKAVPGALRISPHYYNLEEEVERLVEALAEL